MAFFVAAFCHTSAPSFPLPFSRSNVVALSLVISRRVEVVGPEFEDVFAAVLDDAFLQVVCRSDRTVTTWFFDTSRAYRIRRRLFADGDSGLSRCPCPASPRHRFVETVSSRSVAVHGTTDFICADCSGRSAVRSRQSRRAPSTGEVNRQSLPDLTRVSRLRRRPPRYDPLCRGRNSGSFVAQIERLPVEGRVQVA